MDRFFTKTQLKERGWTESMMKRMELQADKTGRNPCFKNAPLMLLYSKEKIENIESSEKFKELLDRSLNRRNGAKKAIETKTKKLLDYADSVDIQIRYLSDVTLTKMAIKSYNDWNFRKGKEKVTIYSDEVFLERIKNNYIRHELTNYDEILSEIKGKVGKNNAYYIIRNKVEERIHNRWIEMVNERK